MSTISPRELEELLLTDSELALIDVREQGAFADAHLLFAVCVPLSRLELLIGDLVPRRDTLLVVVGGSSEDGLADRACRRLAGLGYTNVAMLAGGVAAWHSAGFELFSGVNVPSKAFGEFIEHTCETPRLPAAEVKAMLDEGRDMVIVDARPFEEYHRMNIPTATNVPGAELAFRIHDIAPDPQTLVVVNCAGRTRSIIGAQSLINAGIPNPVVALKDGTMGWHLAGFELERGATREAAAPSDFGMEQSLAAAARVAERFGVQTVTPDAVEQWRGDPQRTTYLLDVRSPAEYSDGHLPGYRNAPGGQLVQATDEYVAVKNARLVLADDIGDIGEAEVTTDMLAGVLADGSEDVTVIDLGLSTVYERHHIPGALWCVRARLAEAMTEVSEPGSIVLTSPDGVLARLALSEARGLTQCDVQALDGGTDRWVAEGRATESGLARVVGETDDVWYKPYEHRGAQEKFMREYLTWEVALVEQIERDGTARFRTF